ncbi:unnamed protein product [Penicillium salamii]|nr:unnamed protein product [Penicillium salamii]CAG8369305.1 unnamed protein product [Penicillium salamii]
MGNLYKFSEVIEANLFFGADILQELRPILRRLLSSRDTDFLDPLTGKIFVVG